MRTINRYRTDYGCTFTVGETSWHSYRDFGLYPIAWPDIPAAQVKTKFIDVPGMDGGLDLSESLTGWPTYKTRKGSFRFVLTEPRRFDAVMTRIKRCLHGRVCAIVKDEEPEHYYQGRIVVDEMKCEPGRGVITLTAELEPFAWEVTNTIDRWLWDPFNFETGVIRQYGGISVSGSKTVTVVSSPAGGCPTIAVSGLSGSLTVTYDGITKTITGNGNHTFPEFELPHNQEEVTFTFAGSATVSIWFRPGVL